MKTPGLIASVLLLVTSVLHASPDALLRAGDTFDLKIAGIPSDDTQLISGPYTIDGEGNLNLAYINKVQAANLTPSQVQASIERIYIERGIFTHPTVTLNIAPSSRLVTVTGEVNSKGRVPYTPDMTLMSAIGAAGDFTIYADQGKVHLIRGSNVEIVNCKKIRGNPSLDRKILPGDSIQVPQAFF